MTSDIEELVRAYYRVVGDLSSSESDLSALWHPDATVVEHPNVISPHGAARTVAESLAGFRAGKALLSAQTFDVHEVLVDGDRAAVRATWTGTVGVENPRVPVGTTMVAHVAAFVVVQDGRILRHETYDCYEPL
ncbi:MAG TPA: nuclear transport factor 2 family protein [Candidatus Nanopelagicales bacterium]|nr:nuclear transport factor 2 family protein [Candidatus Nanopelagicales bacterium]